MKEIYFALWENFKKLLPLFSPNIVLSEELRQIFLGKDTNTIIPNNFTEIESDPKKICDFVKAFENLAKNKYMKVRLGEGATGYRSLLLGGLHSKHYIKKKNTFKVSISNNTIQVLRKTHDFLLQIRNIKSIENDLDKIYYEIVELDKNIEELNFKTIKSYLIKLFACIFPDIFVPIFKNSELTKFIEILNENTNTAAPGNDEFQRDLYLSKLLKTLLRENKIGNKIDLSKYHSVIQVNFLYRYLKIYEDEKFSDIWGELNRLGFSSYPIDEYSTLGLFFLMLKSSEYSSIWKTYGLENLDKIKFLKISDDYPDLIGFIPTNGDDGKSRTIYVELEYCSSRYKHEKEETPEILANLYVICWENDGPGDGISRNELRVISLRDLILRANQDSVQRL